MSAEKLIEKLRYGLPNIETPMMRSDNLAIILCSAFDNPDQEADDTGWSPDAIAGYEEVTKAIHAHYASALSASQEEITRLRKALEDARKLALQWCVSVCDHAIEHYKGPVAMKIRREIAVELALPTHPHEGDSA